MKISTLAYATLTALCIAASAQAVQPAVQPAATPAAASDAALMPAIYASNPANGAFTTAATGDEEIKPEARNHQGTQVAQVDAAAAPVPEPQIFLMMLAGLMLLGLTSSRRVSNEKFTD